MTFTAQQIAAAVGGQIEGNPEVAVTDVSPIEKALPGTLCFVGDEKYLPYLASTDAGIVLLSSHLTFEGQTRATLIRVENARGAMAALLQMVQEVMCPKKKGIEQPCFIAEGVEVPEDAYIGAFAYIAKGAKIGRGAQIYPQTYVGENVRIGDDTILYAGARIYYNCSIGKRCIIHSGAVIGADGFGFEPDAEGVLRKVPQIGNVQIGDDIEIGANTTIDRAMMGSTTIGNGSKIDNLVQLGHNVQIGERTMLCAHVGIAGSTSVGNQCILAGQVGVAGHISITDKVIVGAQAGIAGSIRKEGLYQGSPAVDAMLFRRMSSVWKNLPEMQRIVYRLEKEQKKI